MEEQLKGVAPRIEQELQAVWPKFDEVFPKLEEKFAQAFYPDGGFNFMGMVPQCTQETKVEPPKPTVVQQPQCNVPKPTTEAQKPPCEVPKSTVPKQPSQFEGKLEQLAEMGFTDRTRNMKLLVSRRGDMVAVIRDLLVD